MRVITGTARGRKLTAPEGLDVRPTKDSVKEAIFSAIQFETEGSVGSNRLEYCRTVPTSKRNISGNACPYQRRLNAAIDEQYDRDGKKPLCARGDIFEFCEEPSWIISMKFFSRFFQKWADIYYQDRIILGYDWARGLIIAQKICHPQ